MTYALIVFSSLVALLWLPIGWRFFVAWRRRHNPVSLAICASAIYTAYTLITGSWTIQQGVDRAIVAWVIAAFGLIVAIYYYLSFRWSQTRFKDERAPTSDKE